MIQDKALRASFNRAMAGIVPHINVLGYTAAIAAYQEGQDWLDELIIYLRGHRDYLLREINQIPGLKLAHFDATYLAWIDVSEAQLDHAPAFFEAAGVGLSAGADFGSTDGVRMNFGCTRATLEEAVKRIKQALC